MISWITNFNLCKLDLVACMLHILDLGLVLQCAYYQKIDQKILLPAHG